MIVDPLYVTSASIPFLSLRCSVLCSLMNAGPTTNAPTTIATTAKMTVGTGHAYGAFYMALAGTGASTDMTFALEGASVSPINPEAGIIILCPEKLKTDKAGREKALAEFKANECSAERSAELGYIDSVVTPGELRETLSGALDMLSGKRETTLPKKHSTL